MKTARPTNRPFIYLIVAVLLIAGLACERSVPGAVPKATDTPGAGGTIVSNPTDVMNQIYVFATQTAMALGTTGPQGGTPQAPGATTPGAPATGTGPGTGQPGVTAQPGGPVQPVQNTPQAPAGGGKPVQPPPPLVVPASYTLQKNEFPFCIARRFNVDPGELLRMNGLSSYSIYYAGMVLHIPQTGRTFPGNRALQPHPATYTVGPNDSIFSIACAFGDVDPMGIAAVNGLQPPYKISTGQVLQIP